MNFWNLKVTSTLTKTIYGHNSATLFSTWQDEEMSPVGMRIDLLPFPAGPINTRLQPIRANGFLKRFIGFTYYAHSHSPRRWRHIHYPNISILSLCEDDDDSDWYEKVVHSAKTNSVPSHYVFKCSDLLLMEVIIVSDIDCGEEIAMKMDNPTIHFHIIFAKICSSYGTQYQFKELH